MSSHGCHWDYILSIIKSATNFSFSSRGDNSFKGLAFGKDWTIMSGVTGGVIVHAVRKVIVTSTNAAASFQKDEICCIGYANEDHIARSVANGGIRIGS